LTLRVALQPGPTVFTTDEHEYLEHGHRIDRNRGDEFLETVFSPGWLRARASLEQPACFVASTHAWEHLEFDASSVFDAEEHRLQKLIAGSHVGNDAVAARLVAAADQFVVMPGSRLEENVVTQAQGEELRTVYAGYHWFGDWGRDTMISLEGLTLCTGRYHEAGAILRTFSHYVKDGLLPNLFPEGERQALYHTVDATLWYFHAIARYVEITGDRELVEQLFPVLQSIVHQHVQGTRFGIHVDARDGLVTAAADGYQLTWMDAKVNDWVVTPRRGKPVEIQALWYNALQLMRAWAQQLGHACAAYEELGEQVRHTFNERFWNNGFLFDVVDGPEGDDASVRPNQIFAVSLPHPVLKQPYWRPVVDGVGERLLTPFGLRSLDPGHPSYQRHYRGGLRARDAAYHQGTVWPWLIGPFVDAWLKVHPNNAPARELLSAFEMHLGDAGVGSISEIFDAEAPHLPGGCIAQAWSVAEVLRAWLATRDADDTSQLSSVYERDDGR
jgi:predicted glycogen debranching enzyme